MHCACGIPPLGNATSISWRGHFRKLNSSASPRWRGDRRRILVAAAAAKNWKSSSNGESLYHILGVAPGADEKEIKRAYRRLALKLHPDVNKEPDAQEKFMRIKQAYQTLVDPSKRAKYEASKRSSERRSRSSSRAVEEEDFYGLDDFFRDLQAEFQQKRDSTSKDSQPKSLWEELAELGEEFLEFLEKELNVDTPPQEQQQQQRETNGSASKESEAKSQSSPESQMDDIEELLTKLKKELGLQ
ncbi:uncharacterized protein LOC9642402 [Selaginella moellendorffii]|uniref:DnaJ n=3 Tax=Selaginella moellendorffii TaxID=88036 RepID=S6G3B4_SELML|nr:uncharacterized protein LOC9642402 [Selaginella moellendorffii]DAA64526.1 TPA_inf: DnaJ [Selaginella moellendorffii]|eukprot:XP_002973781.2 uncharacterized protein LOC9642402 [Selaginella moellendorffii]